MGTRALPYLLAIAAIAACAPAADDLLYKDDKGRTRVRPYPVESGFLNSWPKDWEDAFWDRANAAIAANAKAGGFGNTYFENEKRAYPAALFAFLGGHRDAALKALQEEDNQATNWNSLTDGIDFFPCFTLKGQMRKFFLFGPYLDKAYLDRMRSGAKKWTEKDPLRRPNPYHKGAKDGWTPESKNSWVDVRNTDNLQAMRETSVYLMAEEAGNEETRKLYKERIRSFVVNLYHVGQGEWDSNNYHGHTLTAYLNLYDFAKDPEVKALAKAAMDHFMATGAVKYFRGAYTGPNKRDYNHVVPFSGSAADHLALYFGDYPTPPKHYEVDEVHIITSAYRPPQAVVELARKNVKRPLELFASHAAYDALRTGAEKPEHYETTYIGNTFQLGTLARGTCDGDVNGFRLVASDSARGADFFIANATTDPTKMGSAQYGTCQVGKMNVAQNRNLAILLNAPGDSPILFLMPKSAQVEKVEHVYYVSYESTWLALFPINLAIGGADEALSAKLGEKGASDLQIVSAKGTGGAVCGFALEVGEPQTHGTFAAFKKSLLNTHPDVSAAADGVVAYTDGAGKSLKVKFGDLPEVWRNGEPHDWTKHTALYANADGGPAPISLGWKSGKLHVEAGGKTFDCEVAADGKVSFRNP